MNVMKSYSEELAKLTANYVQETPPPNFQTSSNVYNMAELYNTNFPSVTNTLKILSLEANDLSKILNLARKPNIIKTYVESSNTNKQLLYKYFGEAIHGELLKNLRGYIVANGLNYVVCGVTKRESTGDFQLHVRVLWNNSDGAHFLINEEGSMIFDRKNVWLNMDGELAKLDRQITDAKALFDKQLEDSSKSGWLGMFNAKEDSNDLVNEELHNLAKLCAKKIQFQNWIALKEDEVYIEGLKQLRNFSNYLKEEYNIKLNINCRA